MQVFKQEDMIRGWFVGDFTPTALATQAAEVGVKTYQAGMREERHYHKIAHEITMIQSGHVRMNGVEYRSGDIIVIAPCESTDFEVLADTVTVVVKVPGAINDKYLGGIPAMLNIVLPMAGHGSRFAKEGYTDPKPLIPVFGRPMIEVVIDNLRPSQPHRFIFVCQQEHLERYALGERLQQIAPGSVVVPVQQVTQGAACTVLLTRELIDNDDALMIANCDQYVDIDIDDYLARMDGSVDGLIMTMTADDPKWSFVRLDEADRITEVVEKQVVSDEATVGIYNYARGSDFFVAAADAMIAQDLRVNGEFYVAPAYNSMIAEGQRLAYYNIGADRAGMYGLGVPADLQYFIANCGDLLK